MEKTIFFKSLSSPQNREIQLLNEEGLMSYSYDALLSVCSLFPLLFRKKAFIAKDSFKTPPVWKN